MDRTARKSRLRAALEQGRLPDVLRLLAAGASVHDLPDEHAYPIAVATAYGHVDIIKALIARGADIEATCPSQHYKRKDNITENPAWPYSNGYSALHIAAAIGNTESLRVLLRLGANPNSTDTIGATPMMVVCGAGSGTSTKLTMLHSLLKAGADPALEDEGGDLALHCAAAFCETQVVELLLSKAPWTLNHVDHGGYTPLGAAAEAGIEGTMSLLLAAGASEWSVSMIKYVGALRWAVVSGEASSVRFLIENGFEAIGGKLAVARAIPISIEFGHIEILELLLQVGGEEQQEFWANEVAFCSLEKMGYYVPHPVLLPAIYATFLTKFGCPMTHVAAKYCSIPALRVLLSAGGVAEKADSQGKLASEGIGSMLPDDKRNVDKEGAIRRMLQRAPAFRARSWTWPATLGAARGAVLTPAPNTPMGPRVSRSKGEQLFGRSFDRYGDTTQGSRSVE